MHFCYVLVLISTLLASANAGAGSLAEVHQLYKKGKTSEALVALDAYTNALPKGAWGRNVTQARFYKGVILADLKRTDEAIRIFNKLTLDYPGLPEPYNNLAALYVAQGKYEAARDVLERALHTDPTYATLHANLSDVYAKLSSQAYDNALGSASGKAAPERIKELCDNYGKMAAQSAGRKIAPHADADFFVINDIPASRLDAARPPTQVDVDEMAMEMPAARTTIAATEFPSIKPEPKKAGTVAKTTAVDEAKTEKTAAATGADSDDKRAILETVQGWSHAWSAKNVNGYLAYYASNFKLPGGGSRDAWAEQRRMRISRPKSIQVGVESPQVAQSDSTHARVSFRQTYRSDSLQTNGHKTLVMIKVKQKWLIQEEQVN